MESKKKLGLRRLVEGRGYVESETCTHPAKGLGDIFGWLWRGALGKSGGLNSGGTVPGAGTEVGVNAGASWARLAATVLDFRSYDSSAPPVPHPLTGQLQLFFRDD